MSGEGCGLASLSEFVTQILSWSENVKTSLESECNEARYVLRPWPIETIVTKEIDESCCTCDSKASLENHVEEIVEGIGRALAQAQELREKIAINVSKQKRKMREPDVQTIYMPLNSKNALKRDQTSKTQKVSKQEIKNEGTVVASTTKNSAGTSKGSPADVQQKSKIDREKKIERKSKNITDHKLLRVSAGNTITSKAKTAKNFVVANKSNIKNLKCNPKPTVNLKAGFYETNSTASKNPHAESSSQSSNSCSASIAELNRLMDKVSTEEAKLLSSTSSQESKDHNCPFHGANARNVVQERIRSTVDIIEGLDRFGVPGDIVRILKMYHSYSSKELSSAEATAAEKRNQCAANRFLKEFHLMNEERDAQEEIAGDSELANLIDGFGRFFRDMHSQPSAVIEMNNRYAELDSRSKICKLRKFDPVEFRKIKKLKKLSFCARGWSSNGVWNRVGIDSFPDVRRTHCIRYANKSQLLSFFELNQSLQQLLYHGCLIELLIEKVIPEIRSKFHHDTPEYREAYKMIFAIAQVLNPRNSVLVRTDI